MEASQRAWEYVQTQPKKTQYKAAIIGRGIEAKSAPNFPGYYDSHSNMLGKRKAKWSNSKAERKYQYFVKSCQLTKYREENHEAG